MFSKMWRLAILTYVSFPIPFTLSPPSERLSLGPFKSVQLCGLSIQVAQPSQPSLNATMDLIGQVLSLAPVPYLATAWAALQLIVGTIEQVQASREQLRTLAYSIAQLLKTLNGEYVSGNLEEDKTMAALGSLHRWVAVGSAHEQH